MNINAINNQVFQAKMPKTKPNELRVKVLGEVNGYIEKRLADGSAFYERYRDSCRCCGRWHYL